MLTPTCPPVEIKNRHPNENSSGQGSQPLSFAFGRESKADRGQESFVVKKREGFR